MLFLSFRTSWTSRHLASHLTRRSGREFSTSSFIQRYSRYGNWITRLGGNECKINSVVRLGHGFVIIIIVKGNFPLYSGRSARGCCPFLSIAKTLDDNLELHSVLEADYCTTCGFLTRCRWCYCSFVTRMYYNACREYVYVHISLCRLRRAENRLE